METTLLQERFPPDKWGERIENGYDDLVALHGDIVARLELGSYSGDLLYILRDRVSGFYAYLHTGYGSCSGCDTLQSIKSKISWGNTEEKGWDDLAALIHELAPATWMPASELLTWLDAHDWEGDYLGHEEPQIRAWIDTDVRPAVSASRPRP